MTPRVLRLVVALVWILMVAACGSSATAPGSGSDGGVPMPVAGELIGHVTDSFTNKDLGGALVTVISGANAGKSATTDSTGSFRLTGLDLSGSTTVRGTLTGYDPLSVTVAGPSQNIINIKLTPSTGSVIADSVTENIAATDAACAGATGPCKSFQVVTHLQGAWDATLSWVDSGVTLGLELWQNNVRVQSGVVSGTRSVRLQTTLPAGTYELRVRYASGTASTSFTLSGTRPS